MIALADSESGVFAFVHSDGNLPEGVVILE